MDITLARTFLAIVEWGNFVKAAEQLYVTQSTVSSRIRVLEDQLGQPLFVRTKAGASLTSAGVQFKPFAQRLVQTWEQARQEVGLPDRFRSRLSIGVQFTLWERLLARWLPWIRQAIPDYAVRADVGSSEALMRQVVDGLLDLVITYTPQNRSGLVVEHLMEEPLVFVSSAPGPAGPGSEDYIFVDWGPEFRLDHSARFPDANAATLTTTYGPLALQYIRENGGSAYLPVRLVRPYVARGELLVAEEFGAFARPVFVVYLESEDGARFETALQGLRYVAALEDEG
ncbi:MAG: LysR family transcriptional regulator [Hyphomicrobiales bacterium]|nr:LysR family transcriptional regulator [Hyphomicrobiales bacterium]